jgi:hypothetical protein
MLTVLLLLLTTQVPCTAEELNTPVCSCKQGILSSCEVVAQSNPALADRLLKAYQAAMTLKEETQQAAEKAASSCDSSEEPDACKGQWHHIISKLIARQLEKHVVLRGQYKARDPRFVSRAKGEQDHCGYQSWHRDLDQEIVGWLQRNREATPRQFEAYLRDIYNRPELRARFPHGF